MQRCDFIELFSKINDKFNKDNKLFFKEEVDKMTDEEFLNDMQDSFKHKFAKKQEVIEGNMKALQLALNEIKKAN